MTTTTTARVYEVGSKFFAALPDGRTVEYPSSPAAILGMMGYATARKMVVTDMREGDAPGEVIVTFAAL